MPFDLTNVSSTFQSLMNAVFKPFLRKFVLDFFDDILVYSSSLFDQLGHLRLVLETLAKHQLYAKKSKCMFAYEEVDSETEETTSTGGFMCAGMTGCRT